MLMACLWTLTGCQSVLSTKQQSNYQTVQADPNRNTAEAKRIHEKALKILSRCPGNYCCECVAKAACNPCKAEQLLQDALIADVRFGPAHNTLGTVYLAQRKLYLAAWEFEYAAGLMTERGEPHNNLGLVYEEANRLGQAIEHYQEALARDPKNPEYLGNLARTSLRNGTPLEEVRYLLRDLMLYDTRPSWITWAKELNGTNPINKNSEDLEARVMPAETDYDNQANEESITPAQEEELPFPVLSAPSQLIYPDSP